jgi:DNA-binding NtrC family response regulator
VQRIPEEEEREVAQLLRLRAAVSPARQSAPLPRGRAVSALERVARRPVVLVAEDDDELRSLLVSQLRESQCRVIPCSDGRELMHRIEAHRQYGMPLGIDLLVSDVRMPGVTGLELLELLNSSRAGIPVILISAFADVDTRARAAARGVAAFFSKPFDVDRLVSAVAALLSTLS